jgi:hypothetical protein
MPLVKIKVNLTTEEWIRDNQTANRSLAFFASTFPYSPVVFGFEGEMGAKNIRKSHEANGKSDTHVTNIPLRPVV